MITPWVWTIYFCLFMFHLMKEIIRAQDIQGEHVIYIYIMFTFMKIKFKLYF